MSRLRWTQPLTEEVHATVTALDPQEPTRNTESSLRYTIIVSDETDELDKIALLPRPTEHYTIESHYQNQAAAKSRLTVQVPPTTDIARLRFDLESTSSALLLPGPTFAATCKAAITGDQSAAHTLLDAFETPLEIPFVCGSFLTPQEVSDLLTTIADSDRYAQSMLHSCRYPLLRSALISQSRWTVTSATELEILVEGLDAIPGIGDVRVVDVLADVMATIQESIADTNALLDSLGYELSTLEQRQEGLFFMCYLAQLVVTDGLRAAEGHAMRRRRGLDMNYDRQKTEARSADYWDRGPTWRSLVCPAARKSEDEFAFVLANALYWSAENCRSDSRLKSSGPRVPDCSV